MVVWGLFVMLFECLFKKWLVWITGWGLFRGEGVFECWVVVWWGGGGVFGCWVFN